MSAFLRYPGFLSKALTLSYDDGSIHDVRLVEKMKEYGIKGTFNICSSYLHRNSGGFSLSLDEAKRLYEGDDTEVAVHGYEHLTLTAVDPSVATRDIMADRDFLEKEFGKVIRGMAYACGAYNDDVVDMLRHCGIEYARTTKSTEDFALPTDWLRLPATCHHKNPRLMELADKFLDSTVASYFWRNKPKLFYLWGHSFEFNNDGNWEILDRFFEKVGGKDDVWYATNGEIYRYCTAFSRLRFSAGLELVDNPSAIDVYINVLGNEVIVPAGKTVRVR